MKEGFETGHIRSYIVRQGRATAGQRSALDKYGELFCLDPSQSYDWDKLFTNPGPIIVEIGFGNGESLAAMAAASPQVNYLGIEIHRPGVGHLLMLLQQQGLTNVRIFQHDAVEIFEQVVPDGALTGIHLFFPDPWQKRRHHKRRLIRPELMQLMVGKLRVGGYIHTATDWAPYAQQMLKVLSEQRCLHNLSPTGRYHPRPESRPVTKFERRGLRLGHGVWDLIFEKR